MKKKLVWGLILVTIITICLYIYTSFFGNPIKKYTVSRELLNKLEEKYDENFTLIEAFYELKSGSYGGVYQSEKNEHIQFTAENYQSDSYGDYYPEETWLYEINKELTPTAKEIFSDYEQVEASTVWGIGNDEVNEGRIPSYKDISNKEALQIIIRTEAAYSNVNKEKVEQQIFALVQFLQEKSNTVGLMVSFGNPEDAGFYDISGKDIPAINNISDIHKYFIEL